MYYYYYYYYYYWDYYYSLQTTNYKQCDYTLRTLHSIAGPGVGEDDRIWRRTLQQFGCPWPWILPAKLN